MTSGTVAAFLTILGYSMYDTIIVFDRMRENVPRMPRAAFSQIVNRSMSEVLTRSLITGLSTVFLIGVLLVFGGETLQDFAFAMMVGVASGTYSSIFIAAPVLTAWKEREPAYRSRRARIEEAMGCVPTFPEDNVVAKIDEVERHGRGGEADRADGDGAGGAPPSPTPRRPVAARPRPSRSARAAGRARRPAGADVRGDRRRGRRAPGGRRRAHQAPAEAAEEAVAPPAQAREASTGGSLMAVLVWFTTGVALWHFTVFLPDRFWGGIVGAFSAPSIGAMVTGALAQIATGDSHRRDRHRDRALRGPGHAARPRRDLRDRRAPGERAASPRAA